MMACAVERWRIFTVAVELGGRHGQMMVAMREDLDDFTARKNMICQ